MEYCSKNVILFWINQINDYLRSQDLQIDPLPNVKIIYDEQKNDISNVLISTGGYVPAENMIILYADNRHIKDILRSYCHEMIHHKQNLDNGDYLRRIMSHKGNLVDNPELEEIEGDAYLRGNLLFRKFTEQLKNKIKANKNDN